MHLPEAGGGGFMSYRTAADLTQHIEDPHKTAILAKEERLFKYWCACSGSEVEIYYEYVRVCVCASVRVRAWILATSMV